MVGEDDLISIVEFKMSDPRPTKKGRERGQVRAFLNGLRMPFQTLEDGQDPPDVRVIRLGLPSLSIEVTEYHPQDDRVGREKRWKQLQDTLFGLIKKRPLLEGVYISPIFKDFKIPQQTYHGQLSEELVQCVEYARARGWVIQRWRKLAFQQYVEPGKVLPIPPDWIILPAKEWKLLAKYIDVVYLFQIPGGGFMPSNNPQAQTAYCSPYGAAFLSLLEEKEESVRTAIMKGKYSKGESLLWLLIVCNTIADLSSRIFGSEDLRHAVDESGFDFANSPFDEVWLMDESGGGRSQRIHPW